VLIRVADAGGGHLDQDLAGPWLRRRYLANLRGLPDRGVLQRLHCFSLVASASCHLASLRDAFLSAVNRRSSMVQRRSARSISSVIVSRAESLP
jgi:hypothetical protein